MSHFFTTKSTKSAKEHPVLLSFVFFVLFVVNEMSSTPHPAGSPA